MLDPAWKTIDDGLKDLMDNNDSLTQLELTGKSRRMGHLQRFIGTLKTRVDERIRDVKVGPIKPLFDAYLQDRNQVDLQN